MIEPKAIFSKGLLGHILGSWKFARRSLNFSTEPCFYLLPNLLLLRADLHPPVVLVCVLHHLLPLLLLCNLLSKLHRQHKLTSPFGQRSYREQLKPKSRTCIISTKMTKKHLPTQFLKSILKSVKIYFFSENVIFQLILKKSIKKGPNQYQ